MEDFLESLHLTLKNNDHLKRSVLDAFMRDLYDSSNFYMQENTKYGKLAPDFVFNDMNFLDSGVRKKIIGSLKKGSYNLIPSEKKGVCHPDLIVLALGGSQAEDGFDKTMVRVVDHWINCSNQNTIIITNDWSEKHLLKWINVIESYKKIFKANVTIKQYTPRSCSFTDKY